MVTRVLDLTAPKKGRTGWQCRTCGETSAGYRGRAVAEERATVHAMACADDTTVRIIFAKPYPSAA